MLSYSWTCPRNFAVSGTLLIIIVIIIIIIIIYFYHNKSGLVLS